MESAAIDEFVSITQASENVAKQYLGAFDNDVQAAVEAFFEDPSKYNSAPPALADDDVEFIPPTEPEQLEREPMKQVRRRLIQDELPVGRGRGRRNTQTTEPFRDFSAEHRSLTRGTINTVFYHIMHVMLRKALISP